MLCGISGMYFDIHRYLPSRAGPEGLWGRQASPFAPLDSPHPLLTRAAALDPGLGAKVVRQKDGGRELAAATIPHAASGEGSKQRAVFLQKTFSKRAPGPAEASPVLGPRGGWIEMFRYSRSRNTACRRPAHRAMGDWILWIILDG